jgi:hypothetical protein
MIKKLLILFLFLFMFLPQSYVYANNNLGQKFVSNINKNLALVADGLGNLIKTVSDSASNLFDFDFVSHTKNFQKIEPASVFHGVGNVLTVGSKTLICTIRDWFEIKCQ